MPWGPVGKRVGRFLLDLNPSRLAPECFFSLGSTWALVELHGGKSRRDSEAPQEDGP